MLCWKNTIDKNIILWTKSLDNVSSELICCIHVDMSWCIR
jgi:hypothetical protein